MKIRIWSELALVSVKMFSAYKSTVYGPEQASTQSLNAQPPLYLNIYRIFTGVLAQASDTDLSC